MPSVIAWSRRPTRLGWRGDSWKGRFRYNAHKPKKRAIHAIVVARGLLRRASGLLGLRSICALIQRVFGSVQSGFNEIAFRGAGGLDRAARSRRNLQIELSLRQKWSCATDEIGRASCRERV